MEKTVIQKAIEKIDEQIEIAQACRIEASKVRDETSTSRHHGMKIGLVSFKQELINLLELEKLQNHSEYMRGWYNGFNGKEIETKGLEQTAVELLYEELDNILELYPSEWDKISKVYEQAKEMEKEIIRTAYLDGMDGEYNTSEQYYNEKFNKK